MPTTKMSDSTYTIRNYQPSDFQRYSQLLVEAEKLGPTGRYPSPQTLSERLRRPNYSPKQDLFIVETADNMVGYMDITPEVQIGRAILHCLIYPAHRRRGLASELLGYALRRTKVLGAKVAQVSIPEDNVDAKSALSRRGFKFARRFLQMRLDITQLSEEEIKQAAQQCRHLQSGEEEKLTEIQNRSFAGTWGYNTNTIEEITHWINSSYSSPEGIVLDHEGDKAIGYCWTGINSEAEATAGERKGRIFMLGVDPDYRGQGTGKKVLLAGLSYLKSKGYPTAELTVDSQNKVACSLYQSIGFKVQESVLWYEKVVG